MSHFRQALFTPPSSPFPTAPNRRLPPLTHPTRLVLALIALLLLILTLAVPCSLSLCAKLDRSTPAQVTPASTNYPHPIFPFPAPLRFSALLLAIILFTHAILLPIFLAHRRNPASPPLQALHNHLRARTTRLYLLTIAALLLLFLVLLPLFLTLYSRQSAPVYALLALLLPLPLLQPAYHAASAVTLPPKCHIQPAYAAAIHPTFFLFVPLLPLYLIFRDLRALLAAPFVAFIAAHFLHLHAAMYTVAVCVAADAPPAVPIHHRKNPAAVAKLLSYTLSTAASVAHQHALFLAVVVATPLLALLFPYVYQNSYALCVLQHLPIDQVCLAYSATHVKHSLAATICRTRAFYAHFPELPLEQANAPFLKMPIILAFVLVLAVSVLTNPSLFTPHLSHHHQQQQQQQQDAAQPVMPTRRARRLAAAASLLLPFICALATAFILFGPRSPFYKQHSQTLPTYHLPTTPTSTSTARARQQLSTLCRPLASQPSIASSELPLLSLSNHRYTTLDLFGNPLPAPTSTAWRLLLCFFVGLCAIVATAIFAHAIVNVDFVVVQRVVMHAKFGASTVVLEGFGVACIAAALVLVAIVVVVLLAYNLYGAYGVGIANIPMIGFTVLLGTVANMRGMRSTHQVAADICSEHPPAAHATPRIARCHALRSFVAIFAAMRRMCLNLSAGVCFVVLLFVLIVQSNVFASSVQLTGTVLKEPTKHVATYVDVPALDVYVFAAFMIGMLVAFVYCAYVMLAAARSSSQVFRQVETQTRQNPGLLRSDTISIAEFSSVPDVLMLDHMYESVLPMLISVFPPLFVGFGFGKKALIGLNAGLIFAGTGICTMMSAASGVWESACGAVEQEKKKERDRMQLMQALSSARLWGEIMSESVGASLNMMVGTVICTSIVAVGAMKSGREKAWIGLVLLLVWLALTVFVSVFLRRRSVRREEQQEQQEQVDNGVMEVDVRKEVVLNTKIVSPFFESGPGMMSEHVAAESQLAIDAEAKNGIERDNDEDRIV